MSLPDIRSLEESFWRSAGDPEQYAKRLAADAVHVFPGWGVTERERALQGVAGSEPWQQFTIDDLQEVKLSNDVHGLVYTAEATRGEERYRAAMRSVYRRREDGWELVLHQQTPLE